MKRTFAGEVKICMASEKGRANQLDDGRGTCTERSWFEFSFCKELRNHGLCRLNRKLIILKTFASIHDGNEN